MSNKFKDAMFFIGKEVEGRKAGIKTLFVTCKFFELLRNKDVEFYALLKAVKDNQVKNIYLGAAGARWSPDSLSAALMTLYTISTEFSTLNITTTIELSSIDFSILNRVDSEYLDKYADHIFITVAAPALFHSDKYEVKVLHDEHCVVCIPYQKIDTRYTKDEVVSNVQHSVPDSSAELGQVMSSVSTVVSASVRFEATHCWPECPIEEVSFLRSTHRHEFHVVLKVQVGHDDRDVEFIRLKRVLDTYCRCKYYMKDLGSKSCEMIAKEIIKHFSKLYSVYSCSVYEDGENGAEVTINS